MTFSLKNYLLLSAVGASALCSCSNEDFDGFGSDAEARMVEMTVTLAKGGLDDDLNGSRTTLVENGGDLTCLWDENDRVLIATADGTPAGVLTLSDGAGQATATFTGQVDANKINTTYVNVHYFGTQVDPTTVTTTYIHDFSTQPGTLSSLSDYDFLTGQVGITLTGDVITTNYNLKLTRRTAFGRFHLNFPEGVVVPLDAEITVTGSFLHTVGNFGLKLESNFDTPSTNKIVTTFDTGYDHEVWLTILPASAPYTTSLTFTVTAGETTYTGTLAERQWKANEYVRAALDDGTFAGIPVEMTPSSTGGDDNGEVNEYGEPLNNPLAKWAKGNLYRVDGLTNGILEDETDNGALYQWGRNYGYMDSRGFYNENVTLPSDFTNYIDAMGERDKTNDPSIVIDYYVYNPNENLYFMVSGTSTQYVPTHPQYTLWYDSPKFYTSVEDLKANPTKYFMDGTPGSRYMGYGNGVIGMEVENFNPDYWLSSFGNGGSTWAERATACGYENANPCPEGWRIPTKGEFAEIAPEGDGIDNRNNLASNLNNYSEVRETKAGVRYAIRWIYDDEAITVECVVVDNNFTSNSVNELFWDQNKDKKVVRQFPFTGSIQPFISLCDTYYMANEHIIVRPHHRGFVDYTGIPAYGPSNSFYWILLGPGDVNDASKALGAYWTADKNYAFMFEAGEKYNGKNTSNGTFVRTSCLKMQATSPVMGYAIRPVRDYSK